MNAEESGSEKHIVIPSQTMVLPTGMKPDCDELRIFALRVEWRGADEQHPDGAWRVSDGFSELSRAGNWGDPEPYQRHQFRWASREEALAMAHRHVDEVTVNGRTWAEWSALNDD